MSSSSFILLTPRLVVVPTPLAVHNQSFLGLYASVHADASFCEIGFGASYPVQNWTEEQTAEVIRTRDIARSWEPRNMGDFAVGLRSTAQIDPMNARTVSGIDN